MGIILSIMTYINKVQFLAYPTSISGISGNASSSLCCCCVVADSIVYPTDWMKNYEKLIETHKMKKGL